MKKKRIIIIIITVVTDLSPMRADTRGKENNWLQRGPEETGSQFVCWIMWESGEEM